MPPNDPQQILGDTTHPEGPPQLPATEERVPLISTAAIAAGLGLLPAGTTRYGTEGRLGDGASATVFAAVDRDLARQVAVKALRSTEPDDVEGFIAEARLTASLQHPNVLPLYELCVTVEGNPAFTMPRLEGRTFADLIEAPGGVERNRCVSIVLAVTNALAYAHARGIVHQDIKPSNILVGDYGETVVLDWGSAVKLGSGERNTASLYGTPLYMAPEQARHEYSDARSDVYAVGATLFHALIGRPPIYDDGLDAFWQRKRSGQVDPPTAAEARRIPPALLAIATRAMAAAPDDRYATAADLARDLEGYQAGQAVAAYREPLLALLARWYRRNRRLTWVGVLALAMVAGLLALLANEYEKDRSRWRQVASEDFGPGFERRWRHASCGWADPASTESAVGDGSWLVRGDGCIEIHSRADGFDDLVTARDLVGDVRVEFDYTPLRDQNLNCFIDGGDRTTGYTFHIGGYGDPTSRRLTRGGHELTCTYRAPLEPGRTYAFVVERDGQHVRLSIDGDTVIDAEDPSSGMQRRMGRFGFDTCGGFSVRMAHVRVLQRPLALRVSAVAVPQRLMDHGHFDEALAECESLSVVYAGTELEPELLYRIGRCQRLLDRPKEAEATHADLCDRFPRHALVPESLRERWLIARNGRDDAAADARLNDLGRYRGGAVAKGVYRELEADLERRIVTKSPATWDDPIIAPGAVQRTIDLVRSLRERQRVLGVDAFGFSVYGNAFRVLAGSGRVELFLQLMPEANQADCYLELGRFDEAFAAAGGRGNIAAWARLAQDRVDEALRVPDCNPVEMFAQAGRLEDLRQAHGGEYRYLFLSGRLEEALAVASNPSDLGEVLIALARYDEALAIPNHPQHYEPLVALHRHDYAEMLRYPECRDQLAQAAVEAWTTGDAMSDELLAITRRYQFDLRDDDCRFARYWLPALADHARGGTTPAAEALRDALALPRTLKQGVPWHRVRFVLGEIDEATLLAQPHRRGLACERDFCLALRAELAGRLDEAREACRRALAAPPGHSILSSAERCYAAWRAVGGSR